MVIKLALDVDVLCRYGGIAGCVIRGPQIGMFDSLNVRGIGNRCTWQNL